MSEYYYLYVYNGPEGSRILGSEFRSAKLSERAARNALHTLMCEQKVMMDVHNAFVAVYSKSETISLYEGRIQA